VPHFARLLCQDTLCIYDYGSPLLVVDADCVRSDACGSGGRPNSGRPNSGAGAYIGDGNDGGAAKFAADLLNFPPLLLQQLSAIKAALNDDYAYREVAHLTENIGPRPTGSPQAQAARNMWLGSCASLGWKSACSRLRCALGRGAETAALVEYAGWFGDDTKDRAHGAGRSSSTPADGLTAEVVAVNTSKSCRLWAAKRLRARLSCLTSRSTNKRLPPGWLSWPTARLSVPWGWSESRCGSGRGGSLVRSVGSADYRLPHTGFSFPAGIPAGGDG